MRRPLVAGCIRKYEFYLLSKCDLEKIDLTRNIKCQKTPKFLRGPFVRRPLKEQQVEVEVELLENLKIYHVFILTLLLTIHDQIASCNTG